MVKSDISASNIIVEFQYNVIILFSYSVILYLSRILHLIAALGGNAHTARWLPGFSSLQRQPWRALPKHV